MVAWWENRYPVYMDFENARNQPILPWITAFALAPRCIYNLVGDVCGLRRPGVFRQPPVCFTVAPGDDDDVHRARASF